MAGTGTVKFLEPVHSWREGWSRRVEVNGIVYVVSIARGRRVRIMYKPRGENIGYHYSGVVRSLDGKELWSDRVPGSLGARGLLKRAGLLEVTAK